VIADRLGVDDATFKAWTARLDASRDFEEPPPSSAKDYAQVSKSRPRRLPRLA